MRYVPKPKTRARLIRHMQRAHGAFFEFGISTADIATDHLREIHEDVYHEFDGENPKDMKHTHNNRLKRKEK